MDSTLHCNALKCRVALVDQAVVTTCSHVFCLPCADQLELTAPKDGQRKCPACHTFLLNPDDAVVAALNPSEDYKTSILSGLSPTIIIECAGRGLHFWAYQMAQEITYQAFLASSLKGKYADLGAHLEAVHREATEETQKLQGQIHELQAREANMQQKLEQMEYQMKEKSRAMKQVEEMYRKAKQHLLADGIEQAADEDAEEVLQAGTQYRSSQAHAPGRRAHRAGSNGSGDNDDLLPRVLNQSSQFLPLGMSTQLPRGTQSSHTAPMGTPSHHQRLQQTSQRLPDPLFGSYNHTFNQKQAGAGVRESFRGGTPMRSSQNFGGRPIHSRANFGLPTHARTGRPPPGQPFSRGNYGPVGSGRQTYLR